MHDESLSVNGNDYIWSQQWLKDNSSYMNQFPFIFDGSLRYNVFLKNETENGLISRFLHRILSKEDGWDCFKSQWHPIIRWRRQLVTLARMMLHPRPIAILDGQLPILI